MRDFIELAMLLVAVPAGVFASGWMMCLFNPRKHRPVLFSLCGLLFIAMGLAALGASRGDLHSGIVEWTRHGNVRAYADYTQSPVYFCVLLAWQYLVNVGFIALGVAFFRTAWRKRTN